MWRGGKAQPYSGAAAGRQWDVCFLEAAGYCSTAECPDPFSVPHCLIRWASGRDFLNKSDQRQVFQLLLCIAEVKHECSSTSTTPVGLHDVDRNKIAFTAFFILWSPNVIATPNAHALTQTRPFHTLTALCFNIYCHIFFSCALLTTHYLIPWDFVI